MLEQAIADRIRAVLQAAPGLVSAYAFGSVVSGRSHRESDLDLAVRLDRAMYPTAADRFATRLDLLASLGHAAQREVDLVILNDAPPTLARAIMTTGIRLLVRDAEDEHAYLRLTLSRAADLAPFLRRARSVKLKAIAP